MDHICQELDETDHQESEEMGRNTLERVVFNVRRRKRLQFVDLSVGKIIKLRLQFMGSEYLEYLSSIRELNTLIRPVPVAGWNFKCAIVLDVLLV